MSVETGTISNSIDNDTGSPDQASAQDILAKIQTGESLTQQELEDLTLYVNLGAKAAKDTVTGADLAAVDEPKEVIEILTGTGDKERNIKLTPEQELALAYRDRQKLQADFDEVLEARTTAYERRLDETTKRYQTEHHMTKGAAEVAAEEFLGSYDDVEDKLRKETVGLDLGLANQTYDDLVSEYNQTHEQAARAQALEDAKEDRAYQSTTAVLEQAQAELQEQRDRIAEQTESQDEQRRAQKRQIMADQSLSADEKKAKLDELQAQLPPEPKIDQSLVDRVNQLSERQQRILDSYYKEPVPYDERANYAAHRKDLEDIDAQTGNTANPNSEDWRGAGTWKEFTSESSERVPQPGDPDFIGPVQPNYPPPNSKDRVEGIPPPPGYEDQKGGGQPKSPLDVALEAARKRVAALSLSRGVTKKELGEEIGLFERKKLLAEAEDEYSHLALENARTQLADMLEVNPSMSDAEQHVFLAKTQQQMWDDARTLRTEMFDDTALGKFANFLGRHKAIRVMGGLATGMAISAVGMATGGLGLGVAAGLGAAWALRLAKSRVLAEASMSTGERQRQRDGKLDTVLGLVGKLPPFRLFGQFIKNNIDSSYLNDLNQRLQEISNMKDLDSFERSRLQAQAEYKAKLNRDNTQKNWYTTANVLLAAFGYGAIQGADFITDGVISGAIGEAQGAFNDWATANVPSWPSLTGMSGASDGETLPVHLETDTDNMTAIDGMPNTFGVDTNGDGTLDTFMIDNGDGTFTPMIDLDGDGTPDMIDVDNLTFDVDNNYAFSTVVDINNDGQPDAEIFGHSNLPDGVTLRGGEFGHIRLNDSFYNNLTPEQQSGVLQYGLNTMDSHEPAVLASHIEDAIQGGNLSPAELQGLRDIVGGNFNEGDLEGLFESNPGLHQDAFNYMKSLRAGHTFAAESVPSGYYYNNFLAGRGEDNFIAQDVVTYEENMMVLVERNQAGEVIAMYKLGHDADGDGIIEEGGCLQGVRPVPPGGTPTPPPGVTTPPPETPPPVTPPPVTPPPDTPDTPDTPPPLNPKHPEEGPGEQGNGDIGAGGDDDQGPGNLTQPAPENPDDHVPPLPPTPVTPPTGPEQPEIVGTPEIDSNPVGNPSGNGTTPVVTDDDDATAVVGTPDDAINNSGTVPENEIR